MEKSTTMMSTLMSAVRQNSITSMLYDTSIRIARNLVLSQLQHIDSGTLIIEDFDHSTTVIDSSRNRTSINVKLTIKEPRAWIRILLGNDIGFAEAYMLGEMTCSPDLTSFFRMLLVSSNNSTQTDSILQNLANVVSTTVLHRISRNTSEQALINAQNHYSLSNEMFAAFLDPTMTYSSPMWLPRSHPDAARDSLEVAQLRKLRYTIDAARIKGEDHVLEIGTGWGSFAIEAVRRTGCRVTTITASNEQARLARQKIEAAGFGDRIEVLVCDYRHVPLESGGQRFDKVVSIEMIEHVGHDFLGTYFACVDKYLKLDGGIGVFQCITIPEARYNGYRKRQDFIQRYIFPGGHLPTVSGLVESINTGSRGRLIVEDVKSVSGDYVRALREWRENFTRNWESQVKPALRRSQPGSSERDMDIFRRKWEYYFCYCEAGFATKRLGDVSIVVGREGATELIDDIPS